MKLLDYESEYFAKGIESICGVDEAGRGPLAGPVVAAALMPDFKSILDEVNDSKKLTDKKRRELFEKLKDSSICYKAAAVDNETIDGINILNATKRAMLDALSFMFPIPQIVLIDAVKLDCILPVRAIVHGDALSYSIAAASIVAKVTRDDMMLKYAEIYPEYGFEKHKGYGTAFHIEMLKKYGPCPIHRRSFIKNFFVSAVE